VLAKIHRLGLNADELMASGSVSQSANGDNGELPQGEADVSDR